MAGTGILKQPPVRNIDRWLHAQSARLTGGLSPTAIQLAFADWWLHAVQSPAQSAVLCSETVQRLFQLATGMLLNTGERPPAPDDHRFHDRAWSQWPWCVYRDVFSIAHDVVSHATLGIRGVSAHHRQVVNITCHQWLDAWSPANAWWTNPMVQERTLQTGGLNLLNGCLNLAEDVQRGLTETTPVSTPQFRIGIDVACTKGRVVYRNRLVELIQYEPVTPTVHACPILIVPAWIMKFYILDLSPENSLVRYLVSRGHTVFMVSWINPTEEDRDIGMDDYLRLGVMDTIACIVKRTGYARLHAVGYCLGGTLLSIGAAAMGRDADRRLASITLLAAQTDFSEPGDIGLFIDESQVTLLEDSMWETGYLDNRQMAGSFRITQASERLWGTVVSDYLLGERQPLSDLAAWNLDSTRLPYRMHTEYLRHLYLGNDLAQGRYRVDTLPVSLSDIACPIFCVGAERDTVAPWPSVYKIHLHARVDVTFALTSGGHNVGIVNPPGVPDRHYRIMSRSPTAPWLGPDNWMHCAQAQAGSWWPAWSTWLTEHEPAQIDSTERALKPGCPDSGRPAPGVHVLQR